MIFGAPLDGNEVEHLGKLLKAFSVERPPSSKLLTMVTCRGIALEVVATRLPHHSIEHRDTSPVFEHEPLLNPPEQTVLCGAAAGGVVAVHSTSSNSSSRSAVAVLVVIVAQHIAHCKEDLLNFMPVVQRWWNLGD